jgi:hypothetical protein
MRPVSAAKRSVHDPCRIKILGPTHPWRIPRELLERIFAEREAAMRASL